MGTAKDNVPPSSGSSESEIEIHIQTEDELRNKPRKWYTYVWDTFDKPKEERWFMFKLDAALLTFASLGTSRFRTSPLLCVLEVVWYERSGWLLIHITQVTSSSISISPTLTVPLFLECTNHRPWIVIDDAHVSIGRRTSDYTATSSTTCKRAGPSVMSSASFPATSSSRGSGRRYGFPPWRYGDLGPPKISISLLTHK